MAEVSMGDKRISNSGNIPRPKRRWPWVVGGVAALFIAAIAVAAWRLEAWVNATVARELPNVSRTLGRPLRVGSVHIGLLGGASVEVRDIELGPDPAAPAGTVPPALKLPVARIKVSLLPTLLSFGKRVRVGEVSVEGLQVHVTKHANGQLDWQQMADRLNAEKPVKEEPARADTMDDDTVERIRHARLGKLRLNVARVGFSDLAHPAQKAEIRDVNIVADDVGLERSFAIAITAALLGTAKNFELHAAFGSALDSAGKITPPPLTKLDVNLARIDLAPLTPFLAASNQSAAQPALERGAVELTMSAVPGAAMEGGKGPSLLKVNFLLAAAQVQGGDAFDARVVVDVKGDADAGDIDVQTFKATLADMTVQASGSLRALRTAPRFENFAVTSDGLNFDRLQRIMPSPAAAGATLAGPFVLTAKAGGDVGAQQFDARLDLTASSIRVDQSFAKPAGTPLIVAATGSAKGDTVTLDPFALTVADWKLAVRGALSDLSKKEPRFNFKLQTESASVAGLARLLPAVAKGTPGGKPIAGSAKVEGTIVGSASDLGATAGLSLSDLAVRASDTRIAGRGTAHVEATKKGEAIDGKLAVNLTGLEAFYQDVIRKPSGSEFRIGASFTQRGAGTNAQADFNLSALRAALRASIQGDGKTTPQKFDARVDVTELALRPLLAMFPSASGSGPVPDAKIRAQANARGTLGAPETMRVELAKFTLAAGKSDLSATATIDDLARPRVTFDGRAKYLDLDELMPEQPPARGKPAEGKQPDAKPDPDSALVKASGQVKLAVQSGRVSRIDFSDLRADLSLVGGRLRARTLEVGAFGGRFSGAGTELPLAEPEGAVAMKGKVSDLDIDAVIERFGDGKGLLRGKLFADMDLTSRGTRATDVQQSLTGHMGGKLADAELVTADIVQSIAGPLQKAVSVPGFAALFGGVASSGAHGVQKLNGRQLGDLVGEARFSKGAMELTRPLTATTASGPLSLAGGVRLEGTANLTGQLAMSPAAATALTGGKVQIDTAVPVTLAVTGPLRRPSIKPTNLDAVAKTFATAFLTSEAGRALRGKVGKGLESVLNKAGMPAGGRPDEQAAKAQAEAEASRVRAEAAAQEQKQRAQAEAEAAQKRAADEARQRAEQAKQKAAGKLRGVFGK